MKNLIDELHSLTLTEVIVVYESHIADEPSPIIDKYGDDHPDSIITRFKCHDDYELCNIALSRLVIEALISSTLINKIQVRFGYHSEFDGFPGQIYFIMKS